MIGLMFMAGIAAWAAVVVYLCKRIPPWLGITRFVKTTRYLLFPILFLLPIADELIGRWQFHRLCEREAVVHLSRDWMSVKAARKYQIPAELSGYVVPVKGSKYEYRDGETGRLFMSYSNFVREGGVLFRHIFWDDLDKDYCSPKDKIEVLMNIEKSMVVQNVNGK